MAISTTTELRIPVAEARAFLDRGEPVVFLDVRNPQAWAAASVKLPGAIRMPLDELPARAAELPRSGHVVAYCT
jgi:sulfur-carrier protein adenylyltransferase/sulfurtransferase